MATCRYCGQHYDTQAQVDDHVAASGDDTLHRVLTPWPDVSKIIDYENGDLDEDEVVALFQDLVDSGLAWQLQGSYGRTAAALIEQGLVTP